VTNSEDCCGQGWARRIAQIADVWHQLDIWSSHFKEIEGEQQELGITSLVDYRNHF